jgi:hypothetical protein
MHCRDTIALLEFVYIFADRMNDAGNIIAAIVRPVLPITRLEGEF